MRRSAAALLLTLAATSAAPPPAPAQEETADWAVLLSTRLRVAPNITYLTAGGRDMKLDVYTPSGRGAPVPTVVFFHGGGWIRGEKEGPVLHVFPYLEMGWAVVNVQYRVAPIALAPAAVEDARCALRWVHQNAGEYGFDTTRIVATGHSAGGHLALALGVLSESAGFDRLCPRGPEPRVAAVVNWYGITDVNDLLEGANRKDWAVMWLGGEPEREELARRLSPLSHVRRGLPPILTIHGDSDRTVPHAHAVRMHAALDGAGVPNRLLTIPGGGHGGLSPEQLLSTYAVIRDYLAGHGITRTRTSERRP